jgi:hypothetical protein
MFDMTKCKVDDLVQAAGGRVYAYVDAAGCQDGYPHRLRYLVNGEIYTYADNGAFMLTTDDLNQYNIVGFYQKESVPPVRKRNKKGEPSAFAMALDRAMMIYIRDTSSNTTPAHVWVAYIKECMQTFNKMMKSRDVYKGLDPKKLVTARRT